MGKYISFIYEKAASPKEGRLNPGSSQHHCLSDKNGREMGKRRENQFKNNENQVTIV